MHRRSLLRRSIAVATVAVAGCSEQQNRTDTTTLGAAADDSTATPTATSTPAADATIEVGPDGDLRFSPTEFTIESGDTVRWTWLADNHNIVADEIPDDSSWSGTPDSPGTVYDEGYSYRFTFEAPGSYSYYCEPHRALGMTGSFTVEE